MLSNPLQIALKLREKEQCKRTAEATGGLNDNTITGKLQKYQEMRHKIV